MLSSAGTSMIPIVYRLRWGLSCLIQPKQTLGWTTRHGRSGFHLSQAKPGLSDQKPMWAPADRTTACASCNDPRVSTVVCAIVPV